MHAYSRKFRLPLIAAAAVLAFALSGCAMKVPLSGTQEAPPVNTPAAGTTNIKVASDRSVSGTVTTTGVKGIAAHIHLGAAGRNGPVIIPLTRTSDNTWSVPAGAKLTEQQYAAYKAGQLYVNVHSAVNKGGEVRGQLKP
jgi:hypothetical protein